MNHGIGCGITILYEYLMAHCSLFIESFMRWRFMLICISTESPDLPLDEVYPHSADIMARLDCSFTRFPLKSHLIDKVQTKRCCSRSLVYCVFLGMGVGWVCIVHLIVIDRIASVCLLERSAVTIKHSDTHAHTLAPTIAIIVPTKCTKSVLRFISPSPGTHSLTH